MATEGISNFFVDDLLRELRLKPWWETFRGYCFAVSVAVALAITYILQPGDSMSCLPHINGTEVEEFSTPVANFVNKFCFAELRSSFQIASFVALASCGILLVLSSYWLHDPKVIDAFETYARVQTTIEGLQLTADQLQVLSVAPRGCENFEEARTVQKACARILNYKLNFDLRWCYIKRNIRLCIAMVIIILGASFVLYSIVQSVYEIVPCTIPTHEILHTNISNYGCTNDAALTLALLISTFLASICLQLLFVAIGIWKTHRAKMKRSLEKEFRRRPITRMFTTMNEVETNPETAFANLSLETDESNQESIYDNFRFIHFFWTKSRPVGSENFETFFKYVTSSRVKEFGDKLKGKPDFCDILLIDVFTTMGSDWTELPKRILKYLDSRGDSFDCKDETYNGLVGIAHKSESLHWNDDVGKLLSFLYEKRYFKLFVALLDLPSSDEVQINEYLQTLKPNLDAIGQPYETGKSALYYASTLGSAGRAAERMLRNYTKKGYVHCGGFSYEFKESERFSLPSDQSNRDEPDSGLNEILRIEGKFQRKYEELRGSSNDGSFTEIAIEISRLKFTPWNDAINKFAKEICRKGHGEVLVALMNAFIVVENVHEDQFSFGPMYHPGSRFDLRKFVIGNCKLDLNDAVSPNAGEEQRQSTGSLLYFALSKHDYQPFVFTAAVTILSLTKGKEKFVRTDKDTMKADEFVMQNNNLRPSQKMILLKLIKESAPDPPNTRPPEDDPSNQGENIARMQLTNTNGTGHVDDPAEELTVEAQVYVPPVSKTKLDTVRFVREPRRQHEVSESENTEGIPTTDILSQYGDDSGMPLLEGSKE